MFITDFVLSVVETRIQVLYFIDFKLNHFSSSGNPTELQTGPREGGYINYGRLCLELGEHGTLEDAGFLPGLQGD